MTIHYLETYLDNLWDWGFLDECFIPSKIKITDIDGLVERKGRFLLIETKMPDVEIPKGQQILFNALLATGRFHILIVWGKRNEPEYRMFWGYNKKIATNTQNLIKIVRKWYELANKENDIVDTISTINQNGDIVSFQCNKQLDPKKKYRITVTEIKTSSK